jgi:hypothetical protein
MPVPILHQPTPRATPVLPAASVPAAPRRGQQTSIPAARNIHDGLATEELITIIRTYRGHVRGLEGLSRKELMAVLEHHRVRETCIKCVQCANQYQSADTRMRGVKHEPAGDAETGRVDKRRKEREVIILDD